MKKISVSQGNIWSETNKIDLMSDDDDGFNFNKLRDIKMSNDS